jgi:hypothetical protein
MTTQEAYRGGFMLKCAQLGIPAGFASAMLDRPEVVKKSVLGAALGVTANAGIGAARGAGKLLGQAQQAGTAIGNASASAAKSPDLSEDAIRNILLSSYYERARRSLLSPQS